MKRTLLAFCVGLLLACGGLVPAEPPPTPVLSPPTPVLPPPTDPVEPPTGRVAPTPTEVEQAYLLDCHHVFKPAVGDFADLEMSSGVDNECQFLEFDQNCAPDMFNCWSKSEACNADCGNPCDACQETCASTCDTSKAACSGDPTCLASVAKARATCRDSCLQGRESCIVGCAQGCHQCEKDGETMKHQKCPDCDGIRECLIERWSSETPPDCNARFPNAAGECFTWCDPGQ